MKNFSNILSEYVHERKTNISALSSETGIDRTLLHKYISGSRTPSGIETVLQISDGLMLSDEEKFLLCDSYRLASLGEEGYERFMLTEKIFDFLSSASRPYIPEQTVTQEYLIPSVISDRFSVDMTIRRIISDCRSEKILVITPPSYHTVCTELVNACLRRSELRIIQIMMFSPCDSNLNLRTMRDILPLLVFCDKYTPLINYSMNPDACSSSAMFPNVIITSRYVFCFSSSGDMGILHTSPDIVGIYHKAFSTAAEKSRGLITCKITSAPKVSENTVRINSSLFAEQDKKKISLTFRTGSYWSSILIYEQSIRKSLILFLEEINIKKAFPEQ